MFTITPLTSSAAYACLRSGTSCSNRRPPPSTSASRSSPTAATRPASSSTRPQQNRIECTQFPFFLEFPFWYGNACGRVWLLFFQHLCIFAWWLLKCKKLKVANKQVTKLFAFSWKVNYMTELEKDDWWNLNGMSPLKASLSLRLPNWRMFN